MIGRRELKEILKAQDTTKLGQSPQVWLKNKDVVLETELLT